MKKVFFISFALLVASGIWLFFVSDRGDRSVLAQTDEAEASRKRDEHDEKISQEKVDRAHLEARTIKEAVIKVIAKHKPKYEMTRTSQIHELRQRPGRKGTTLNEFSWKNSKSKVFVVVALGYDATDVKKQLDRGMEMIQMGDFFALPNVGDEAILVKNVTANKSMTDVGIHFLKGRAQVDIYFTNHFQTTAKNEKELMEFVKLIEPLIVARPKFDD